MLTLLHRLSKSRLMSWVIISKIRIYYIIQIFKLIYITQLCCTQKNIGKSDHWVSGRQYYHSNRFFSTKFFLIIYRKNITYPEHNVDDSGGRWAIINKIGAGIMKSKNIIVKEVGINKKQLHIVEKSQKIYVKFLSFVLINSLIFDKTPSLPHWVHFSRSPLKSLCQNEYKVPFSDRFSTKKKSVWYQLVPNRLLFGAKSIGKW